MGNLTSYLKPIYRLSIACVLFFTACANPVSPTGGPKDTTPPEVTKSEPANQSVNFTSDKVTLTFSEFVSLKEISNQLVISPPMGEQPEFTIRGKSLIMKFKEALRANTTYNFFFGDAIVDITESNPLAGFQFTFSTGAVLDSLSVSGNLTNAFTNQPVKGAFVMLYDTIYDSIPYKERPYYLARTGASGEYSLNNLRQGNYLMFSLTDINADYIYNLPTEEISFSDSIIKPGFAGSPAEKPDSLTNEETTEGTTMQAPTINLRQFREADTVQRILKASLLSENVLSLAFSCSTVSPEFKALQPELNGHWYYESINRTRDTITLWIPNPGADSLTVAVSDTGMKTDTLEFSLKPRTKLTGKKQTSEPTDKKTALSIKNFLISSRIKPDQPLVLKFSEPVIAADFDKIQLTKDSIQIKPSIAFTDSVKTRLELSYPWAEGSTYRLILPDSIFTGAFSSVNDSTAMKFTAYSETETGSLKVNISIPEPGINYIVQLLGDKETLIEQHIIEDNAIVEFKYLSPKKYRLKVIIDSNKNQKWDTGRYLKKLQPEFVIYHPKEFELRSNWTMEEDWQITMPD